LKSAASRVGLDKAFAASLSALRGAAAWSGRTARAVMTDMVEGFSALPVIGPLVGSYAAHFERAEKKQGGKKLSDTVRGFFERWSIKFSAEYYEAREQDAAPSQPLPGPEPLGLR
jgi:hypothetical protein